MYPGNVRAGRIVSVCIAVTILFSLVSCLIPVAGARKNAPASAELDAAVRAAWKGIGSSESRCGEYDYFPGGGMRNFYCHAMNFIEYRRCAGLAGIPVFISGPHTAETLTLDSRFGFGKYNPEFVARLGDLLIPGDRDSSFRAATQGVYDESIKPLARVFFVTYRKLMDNPVFLVQEKNDYINAIKKKTLEQYHYEKYYSFLECEYPIEGKNRVDFEGPGFDGICDGNVVKTCVAFWIRRSIDGTDDEFYAGLEKLLNVYDRAFLKSFRPYTDDVK